MKGVLCEGTMVDMITCGSCRGEFPLRDITVFIQHKAFDCRGPQDLRRQQQVLKCSSCDGEFCTSWGLLHHIQEAHNLRLYSENLVHQTEKAYFDEGRGFQPHTHSRILTPAGSWDHDGDSGDHTVCVRLDSQYPDSRFPQGYMRSPRRTDEHQAPARQVVARNSVDGSVYRAEDSQVLPLDLKISVRENRPVYHETPSDSDNCSMSSVDVTPCSHPSIIPKKRKWSVYEPSSDECTSPDTMTCSPCESRDSVHDEVSSSCTSRTPISNRLATRHSVDTLPNWKYSVDLQSSPPAVSRGSVDRNPNSLTSDICLAVNTINANSPTNCTRQQDSAREQCPQSERACATTSPEARKVDGQLGDVMTVTSRERSVSTEEFYPFSRKESEVGNSEALAGRRESPVPDGLYGAGKKRRYPTTRPFKCDHCEHSFNQRIHLKKHLSKHTGIKPFKCGLCDYSTVERSHLKVHIRIHTGEKPYKCTFCDYATAQNSTLKIHLKRHHGGRMFRCKFCAKCFTQCDMLDSHMVNHVDSSSNQKQADPKGDQSEHFPLKENMSLPPVLV